MQYHLKVSCFFDSASSCSDSSLYIDRILVNLVHFILRNPNVSFSSAVLFFVSQGISQLFKQCFRYFTVFHLFFLIFNSSLMCKSYSFLNYFLQCRLDICRINFDFLLFSICCQVFRLVSVLFFFLIKLLEIGLRLLQQSAYGHPSV